MFNGEVPGLREARTATTKEKQRQQDEDLSLLLYCVGRRVVVEKKKARSCVVREMCSIVGAVWARESVYEGA